MDLTRASDSDGKPEAKHERRYSPRRTDRSPPRRRSPGYRHDNPPAGAAVPTATSDLTPVSASVNMIATPPPLSCPITTRGDQNDPRVAMAQDPYAPALEPPSRSTPIPAVLRAPPEGPLGQETTAHNEETVVEEGHLGPGLGQLSGGVWESGLGQQRRCWAHQWGPRGSP